MKDAPKDYYRILGVNLDASEEEIRRAYKRLALQHHPDRNPGDSGAEERFKELSEAYGVLMDREKRSRYDRLRQRRATPYDFAAEGFTFDQEEIFREIFENPHASQIFREMGREFSRMGLRFNEEFFSRTFFGGRGFVFGGVFYVGPFSGSHTRRGHGEFRPRPRRGRVGRDLASKLGKGILHLLTGGEERSLPRAETDRKRDISYTISIPRGEAQPGKELLISYPRGEKREKLTVKLPDVVRPGMKLRLRGKGMDPRGNGPPGDLYLRINLVD